MQVSLGFEHITVRHFNVLGWRITSPEISTAAVFLNIEKHLDKTWHPGLLYKLSELEFSTSIIKLLAFFPLTENLKSW
jgi:hypothetical protein